MIHLKSKLIETLTAGDHSAGDISTTLDTPRRTVFSTLRYTGAKRPAGNTTAGQTPEPEEPGDPA